MPSRGLPEWARQAASGKGACVDSTAGRTGAGFAVPLLKSSARQDSRAPNPIWARESSSTVLRGVGSRVGTGPRLHEENAEDARAGHHDRGDQNDGLPRAAKEGGPMKKLTNWDLYFRKQLDDPETRKLIEGEIESLRVGTQIARMRQKKRLSQAQPAARA